MIEKASEQLPEKASGQTSVNAFEAPPEDDYKAQLVRHLLGVDSAEAMDSALDSLLTPSEYQEISKRLQIFKLLSEGVPHRKIAEALGVGIATVSRGARAFLPPTASHKELP
ncbi:Trp family transcriptional regulator [Vreelandella sp. EE22]